MPDRIKAAFLIKLSWSTCHFLQGDELHWYNFEGDVVQLCKLPGVICFARAHSEPSGLESLLLNLSNGAIMRVVPGLPEAELLISHDSSVRCGMRNYT